MYTNTANKKLDKVIYPKLSYKICGLCFQVHNELGRYRNEKQYSDALEEKFKENRIEYNRENAISQSFKGENKRRNITDFIIDNKIIIEIKTKRIILKEDYYQIKRYLVSANKKLGLIVNFRQNYLNPIRVLNKEYKVK